MGKGFSRKEVKALEQKTGRNKAAEKAAMKAKNARNPGGQADTRKNHEDNEEWVQIHKSGK